MSINVIIHNPFKQWYTIYGVGKHLIFTGQLLNCIRKYIARKLFLFAKHIHKYTCNKN